MDKSKHELLNILAEVYTEYKDIEKKLERMGEIIRKYAPITNLECEKCGEALYEVKNRYVCLKCKRVFGRWE